MVIRIKPFRKRIRIAGTRVSLEIKIAEIGAKNAENCAHAITMENIRVTCFFSASSIKRQVHELLTTPVAPLRSAAARKNQKFSARHQIKAGIHHAKTSKIAVDFLLPILSITGPLKTEKIIWESMLIVTIKPIRVSLKPNDSI